MPVSPAAHATPVAAAHRLCCGLTLLAAHLLSTSSAAGAPAQTQAQVLPEPPSIAVSLNKREIRAQLVPLRFTTLAAEIGATISSLPVHESGSFKAGQTLVQLDCSLPQAQLAKARAMLDAAEKIWQVNQRLAEQHSIGQVELVTSEADVRKARAEVDGQQAVLGKCRITAPFSGRISEQKVHEQQYVQPGQPLLEILDDSALEIKFIAPSRWLAWIKPGQRFQVQIDETGRSYPAKLTRIAARIDAVSQSVKLTGVVDGKFSELLPGMSGKVLMAPPTGH